MRYSVLVAVAALAVGLGSFRAGAVVVIGNLPGSPGDAVSAPLPNSVLRAVSFTVGVHTFSMDNAKLRLSDLYTFERLAVQVYSNSSGNPGSVLPNGDLGGIGGNDGSAATFTATASGLTLSPDTTYWLVLYCWVGDANWTGENPQITPSGVATFGSYKTSSDGGGSWSPQSEMLSFEINGTTVPEPHEWAMGAGLGLLGFGLLRRRAAASAARFSA